MAYKIIAQDAAISISDGGIQDGSGGNFATSIDLKIKAKSISFDDKANTVDTRGWGDARRKSRATHGQSDLQIDVQVDSLGPLGDANSSVPNLTIGNYIKVLYQPAPTASVQTWIGVLVGNKQTGQTDEVTMQTLTIECDAA